ncbi:rhodanese-like domain-containing protein [Maritimibacter sp. DP07]|uniref:Rhodanese-like domain-containing protein n=1 Tax=Maritimibacter harenae TaxID=2606218 RepID=A0A845M8A0_9RHOB|nr:rhodanese-like domain-containing protein [Maritimibacter harenae]MZR13783.1 rhodanese-like domain-containing protein [Maritimibacter harenae]
MTLKHLLAVTSLTIATHAVPVWAQDAAIDAMQEYMMFSDYEAGIILPQQIDKDVFETALFVDTRDAGQFEEGTIPGAVNIEWREVLDRIDEIPEDSMTILFCNTGSLSAQAAFALRVAGRSNVVVMQTGLTGWQQDAAYRP